MVYEIRLGPYESLEDAKRAEGVVRRSHGLAPQVLVLESSVTQNGDEEEVQ